MLIHKCPDGVKPFGRGIAVDLIIPSSLNYRVQTILTSGRGARNLEDQCLPNGRSWVEWSIDQLEARPPDFLGHFGKERRRSREARPSWIRELPHNSLLFDA